MYGSVREPVAWSRPSLRPPAMVPCGVRSRHERIPDSVLSLQRLCRATVVRVLRWKLRRQRADISPGTSHLASLRDVNTRIRVSARLLRAGVVGLIEEAVRGRGEARCRDAGAGDGRRRPEGADGPSHAEDADEGKGCAGEETGMRRRGVDGLVDELRRLAGSSAGAGAGSISFAAAAVCVTGGVDADGIVPFHP